MDVKIYKKPMSNFIVSDRTRLLARASSSDNMLRKLPRESEWKELNPDGPSLKQKRDSLVAVREDALAALKAQPLDLAAKLEGLKTATTGLPVYIASPGILGPAKEARGDGFSAYVNRIFTDGPCPEKKVETIYIDPEGSYKQCKGFEDAPVEEATDTLDDGSAIMFDFRLTDPNNDPWDSDYVEGWLRLFWAYELPAWPYNATYKLNIYGRLIVQTEMFSNNFLGHRLWAGYFVGGMAADNELVQVDNKYQPIYTFQKWTDDQESWDSRNVYLTKNWFLEAGESQSIFLYYWIYLFADRGTVNSVGSVYAKDNPSIPSHPRLKCTISPV